MKTAPLLLMLLAAACSEDRPPVERSQLVACDLLSAAEVHEVLGGIELRQNRELQAEDWICNWTSTDGERLVAQLLVTPVAQPTFEAYRDQLQASLGADTPVERIDGVGEYAAWTMDSMLFVRTADRGVQVTLYRDGTPEVARALAQRAIERLSTLH